MTADAANADGQSFLTFVAHGHSFALPSALVREVLRRPEIVPVPLTPRSLEGLANLRGEVLAVANLARLLGLGDAAGERVLVIDHGNPVGLVVDRVTAMVTAQASEVESAADLPAPVAPELLRGVLRQAGALVLDPERLLDGEFAELRRGRASRGGAVLGAGAARISEQEGGGRVVIGFEVAGQEYALPVETVREIVRLPASRIGVPGCGAHVLGLATLRDRLLPLVSLAAVLGLPDAPPSASAKVVVASLGADATVGLVVDRARAVLRVDPAAIVPMPPMLARGQRAEQIEAIARLGGGRLVALLSPERLLGHYAVREALDARDGYDQQGEQAMAEPAAAEADEQFVVFALGEEEYAVPVAAVQEIMRLPDALTRLAKAPRFIEGVTNRRGAVLPVLDQRRRFDLPRVERNPRQRIVVLDADGVSAGFIVDAVTQVLRIPAAALGPAPALSAEQARLIARVANLPEQNRMILVLDVAQLLDRKEAGALSRIARDGG